MDEENNVVAGDPARDILQGHGWLRGRGPEDRGGEVRDPGEGDIQGRAIIIE